MSQQLEQPEQLAAGDSHAPLPDLSRPAILSLLLVFVGMLWPLAFGRLHTSDDLWRYHYPLRSFYADCLARGDAFDWMPSIFCGFYLTGTGQAGTYHPWHWLLYQFLPLPIAFTIEITASYPFMLIGMRFFLQRWVTRSDSAWLGSSVFTLSGFCLLHFLHPNAIAVVSHLPWLLYLLDRILRPGIRSPESPGAPPGRNRWQAETGLAFLTGSQLLLGYPQYVCYTLLAELIYVLIVASRELSFPQVVKRLCVVAGLKLLGAGLGAIQILPSVAALAESDRRYISAEEFNQYPLTPFDMLQWFAPYLTSTRVFGNHTHELGAYCGSLSLLLALLGMRRRFVRRSAVTLQVATLTLAIVALWLSFGADAGLYAVQLKLPLVGKFRWPSRIVVLLHFCTAVFAALAFDHLASRRTTIRPEAADRTTIFTPRILFIIPTLSVLASATSIWFVPPELAAPTGLLIVGPVLAILAAVMVADLCRGRCAQGFMVFLIADLAIYGFTYEPLHKTESLVTALTQIDTPPADAGEGRILSQQRSTTHDVYFTGNQATLHGWSLADGYEGLRPKVFFLEQEFQLDGLRIAGVRWVPNAGIYRSIDGLRLSSDTNWLEVPDPLPTLRTTMSIRSVSLSEVYRTKVQADGPTVIDPDTGSDRDKEILQSLRNESVIQTAGGALAEGTTLAQGSAESTAVDDRIEIIRSSPGCLLLKVTAEGNRLLVWNQRFSVGWTVVVDGVARPPVRTDFDFLGTTIEAGTQTVEFRFQPDSLDFGRKITGLSLGILFGWAIVRRRMHQTKSEITGTIS